MLKYHISAILKNLVFIKKIKAKKSKSQSCFLRVYESDNR